MQDKSDSILRLMAVQLEKVRLPKKINISQSISYQCYYSLFLIFKKFSLCHYEIKFLILLFFRIFINLPYVSFYYSFRLICLQKRF